MLPKTWFVCVILITTLAGCAGRNKPVVGLDVDLYLHPEATQGDDLILQSALQKELSANPATREDIIHVRVIDGIVFLIGTVKSQNAKIAAEDLAAKIEVTVNGRSIKASGPLKSRLEVNP